MPPSNPRSLGPSDRFASVADRLVAPLVLLSGSGRITFANRAAAGLLRQETGWLIGRSVLELVHNGDRRVLRAMLRGIADGEPSGRSGAVRMRAQPALDWRVVEWTADDLTADEDVRAILVGLHDVTASHAENRALADLAYRDPLTGLANRSRAVEELSRLVASDGRLTVALVSIDRLSLTEDSLGQVGAEALISHVGRRIRSAIPASGLLARLDGGTFIAVLAGSLAAGATGIAWRINKRVRAPVFVDGRELLPSVSIGTADREASATAESLLWDAGLALHRAQARGGDRVEAFSREHRQAAVARLELEAELRRAVAEGSLALAFQPIVRLDDRTVTGSEALLRWRLRGRDLAPADFVPLAEESGLIVPIGEWVVDQAARHARSAPGGRVSVNLSARQLATPGLPRILDEIVTAHADRSQVEFEVTETMLMDDWEYTAGVLEQLRRLGFRVGLDDFGTGYSSLGYLRRLPLDFLKLDRTLVEDIDGDPQARAIVGAVIRMAAALDVEIVAEGVERERQAEVLVELGAQRAQGFLFGVPAKLPALRATPDAARQGKRGERRGASSD